MEYHYSEHCLQSEHLLTDDYGSDYSPQFLVPTKEGEYEVRSSVLVDGGERFGVSAVVFDKHEELIWMGNQGGHVTSYYGPSMQKYTSFQIHESEEVRDIVTDERGIYALTKTILRHQMRRGIPKHTFRSESMNDMQCLLQVSPTKLMLGGHQRKLLELDVTKMTETIIPIKEDGCVVMRNGGASLLACGSANGHISLRDLRTPNASEHTFKAHNNSLSDMDMQGDLLISCGFTQSAGGVAVAEPYVVVWDLRCLKGTSSVDRARSIHTAAAPMLLHFLPAFSGRAVALSGDGHIALLHVNAPQEKQSIFQVDTQSSMSVMDVSSTSQALVFGDQGGHLHLFSPRQNKEPVFNNFSRETEFADQLPTLPTASLKDKKFKFSSIKLPTLNNGKWCNELPPEFFKKAYRKPKPIDPELLSTMKMKGPIGYAPNPKTTRRNQMPYITDNLEDLSKVKQYENKCSTLPIPEHYQKLDLHYNKHGSNEELESYNKTKLPGLEATIPNSYCNPMLQVLYYIPPLKATLLAHTCAKEFCLSCELGFLFRMLDTSNGVACQANNFLRAFRTVPEAAALGLILTDTTDSRPDLMALIQSWIRFILHQIHSEILETRKKDKELAKLSKSSPPKVCRVNAAKMQAVLNGPYKEAFQFTKLEFVSAVDTNKEDNEDSSKLTKEVKNGIELKLNETFPKNVCVEREESEISQLFAIGRHQMNRCLKCNKEEERESVTLACLLQYGECRAGGAGGAGGTVGVCGGFADLVQASLSARRSTPAWCDTCSRFTPTAQRGRLTRLPPILAINCGGVTPQEKAFWSKGVTKDVDPSKKNGTAKPCRYGVNCARAGCRFKHPDNGTSPPTTPNKIVQESNCVLPHHLVIRQQSDGDVAINDKELSLELNKQKKLKGRSEEEYTLSAAVVCVDDNPKNLVAYIQVGKDNDPKWYLFNDLSIVPVSADEVVEYNAWWKSPCVLLYTAARARNRAPSPAPAGHPPADNHAP
ncbi:PREDICTED: PAB-dependent poly(A)-specific ribonuclease subunit PAN2 isoform X2 [Papilio polytes]|uniref:PAB-dependent poly(A)-specific ribonuclease subunit PAN2 isoform X2 n=1 Tax=Papilio polytes TaxID=76194 RepID=UPI000676B064|nr:PREDICTED: PAB-dependent poly(A)-specific ribonuclease subunit PAN2 isoform X2 [Papilio polytes]